MDLPAASWEEFFGSIDGTGEDDHAVGPALIQLIAAVRGAVPSYRGMRVTVLSDGHPVHLDAFRPADDGAARITTSLRLPLVVLSPRAAGGGRIVLYATTSGAFVDLAADLQYVLAAPPSTGDGSDGDPPEDHGIRLDHDLPPATEISGLTGIEDAAAIGRAVGFMIAAGHPQQDALATLHARAAAAGLTPQAYAGRLLGR